MAKKTKQNSERPARRAAQREGKAAERKPEVKRPYTLLDCMKMGCVGNILFVVFIVVCLIYYYSFAKNGTYLIPFEIVAYVIETTGFALFSLSVIWMDRLVRARGLMKVLMLIYIVVEVLFMLLEFELVPFFSDIYFEKALGLSVTVIICHVIFSAGVAFSLLMLDPQNKKLQIIVAVTSVLMLCGMFFALTGYRVYSSLLLNAFAYIIFYASMIHRLRLEEVDIDCYGDRAEVKNFSSTMFADSPLMKEISDQPKKSLLKTAKQTAEDIIKGNEEKLVLTDRDEKFEYEFDTVDDGDDDFEDEDDEA